MATSIPPSSSSSLSPRWSNDVFLSFSGEDTREGFTSHLYYALHRAGIATFMDSQLLKGGDISSQLCRIIEQSRFSIVVFSENYLSSVWCLSELVKIMERKKHGVHVVIPVFYKIEPREIRNRVKNIREHHLSSLSKKLKNTANLLRLLDDLKGLADLSGSVLKEGMVEYKLIQEIVKNVLSMLNRTSVMWVADYPVGLDNHIERINPLLGIGMSNEVRIIGIHGDMGMGKSTIAREIFNLNYHRFEGSSFLENLMATRGLGDLGIVKFQETLLRETLGGDGTGIPLGNSGRGVSVIMERLRCKKVLVVIDGACEPDQLRKLAGGEEWFGPGSRIIITTRDHGLLRAHGVKHLHNVVPLDCYSSSQLFCWNAFRQPYPPESHAEPTRHVLESIAGIPMALRTIGLSLHEKRVEEWENAIYFLNGKTKEEILRICNTPENMVWVKKWRSLPFMGQALKCLDKAADELDNDITSAFRSLFPKISRGSSSNSREEEVHKEDDVIAMGKLRYGIRTVVRGVGEVKDGMSKVANGIIVVVNGGSETIGEMDVELAIKSGLKSLFYSVISKSRE